MKVKFLLMVGVCLFLVGLAYGQTSLKVVEAETKAFSTANGLQINLVVESDFEKNRAAKVNLEILDKSDMILARNYSTEKIERGKSVVQISFRVPESDAKTLLWHRLSYSITVDGKSSEGIVSLSEIMPELFGLRVESSEQIFVGMLYQARVRAVHPTKNTPVADVEIDAELELETDADEGELTIKAHSKTDGTGYAILEFQIPPNVKFDDDESGDINIIGTKNGLKSEASESLNTGENQPFVYFMTDKPLYQPAQKIYVRGLAMRKNRADAGMTIAAEKEFEFSIKDEEDKTLFRQKVKTSRFGVAAIEWQIPANAKLGSYRIEAKDEDAEERGYSVFKVSRYDLPNFVVQTRNDKDFYLPEQTQAEVTVDALYLFGKPVAGGKVKVVQEGKREWNYYEQKWDIQEEATYEGETDADGKYVAKIDLSKAHEKLRENDSSQFQDLNFAAYFTDSTTNKTEQRRFDVRVTREPIHIYLTKGKGGENNPNLPLQLYVSTFSADGKPTVCDVEIKGKYEDEAEEKTIATIKTNSRGAGKIEFSAPKREDEIYYEDLEIKVAARNAENATGTAKEKFLFDEDEKIISVRTDKTLYRQGEPMKIEILSSEADETVFVDVLSSASTLQSRRVRLKNGRAELKIPYNSAFKNYLIISAFFAGNNMVQDSNGVVYPQAQNLQITAETNKEVFRPAEEAQMNFTVSTSDKKQTEAALGVVILDKAVEERARTDADFGGVNIFQNFGALSGGWNEIDTKNLTAEQQLSAEMQFANTNFERNIFGGTYAENLQYVFGEKVRNQLYSVQNALYQSQNQTYEHPIDEDSLRKILSAQNINFDSLRDPWGNAFRAKFSVNRNYDVIEIVSAGANETFGDADDFTGSQSYFQYFFKEGAKINEAVQDYAKRTGKFVRDRETLQAALAEKDINLDELKDRWGEPYKINFSVYNRYISINFQSGGADKKFDGNYYDDFTMWTTYADYYTETERKITQILSKFIADKKTFPATEAEFKQILRDGGVDFDSLRDGWNRPFYLKFETRNQTADKIIVENTAKQGEKPKEILTVKSFAQQIGTVEIRSTGVDGVKSENNYQDGWLGTFGGLISEQPNENGKVKLSAPKEIFVSGKSAIYGVVTDANKAIVPNARVKITNTQTLAVIETKTNEEGLFLQTNLAAGRYSIKIEMSGFKTSMVNEIRLDIGKIAETNFTLEVGGMAETVSVTAESTTTIEIGDTKIDSSISRDVIENLPSGTTFSSLLKIAPNVRPEALAGGFQIDGASGSENVFLIDGQEVTNFRSGISNYEAEYGGATGGVVNVDKNLPVQRKETPRLREYFPETLLWIPELVTDTSGKVSIKFRLADNITTWKIYAIASDTSGRVGVTSKEIKAFQPFFVDLDPPKFLTEGDEIYLPTQVRNYTPDKQKVNVEMSPSDWFSFLGAGTQTLEVEPSKTQNAVFGFKAITPITEGKQRVTAIADTDSDAIEKPVTVRPNGQEIVRTESKLFNANAAFDINFPENALPKTPKAELKIYPNLLAHVTESVDGLLRRPYGCGEQTISSTYPNLMILRFGDDETERQSNGEKNVSQSLRPKVALSVRQQAKKYLQAGYERLSGYQVADGGFSYWGGKDSSNLALTAYALRFLSEAKSFIQIDENAFQRAQSYLIAQQKPDGSFSQYYYGETTQDLNRTKMFTAYIVRTLAMDKNADKEIVQKALNYLKSRQTETDEPYVLALFGLASLDAGNAEDARIAAEKLQKLVIADNDTAYWNLDTSTPFYGWGMTGKIETTAVVLQFLQKTKDRNENLIAKSTLFLLKNKDRYGVWYSTQTTINVLNAFLASLSESKGRSATVSVSMNGEKLKDFTVPADQIEPIILDLSDKLASANRLEITSSDSSTLMAQIVATHYIDWSDADLASQNRGLSLKYECDKQTANIMDEINCTVEAGRIGTQSWGMLLAEIGLPPGADVSRESLENALKNDWSLSRYEILPDRIVLYLWSQSGGTKFNFKFKPRYGINANTPASIVYDYYNPEAQAMVAPLKFLVK